MLAKLKIDFQFLGSVYPPKIDLQKPGNNNCKFLQQINIYNKKIAHLVSDSIKSDHDVPLIIGEDHSISIGTVSGILQKRKKVGLLWLDAHPDIHTDKTTQTGWVYGMPSAIVCGFGHKKLTDILPRNKISPKNLALFGAQYIDPEEYTNIKKFGTNLISMEDIIEKGLTKSLDKAISIITKNTNYVHISLDLDVIDDLFAPGTTEYSLGQLTYREIKYVLKKLAEKKIINSIDIVEGDPPKDIQGKTVNLVLELIALLCKKSYSPYDQYLISNKI